LGYKPRLAAWGWAFRRDPLHEGNHQAKRIAFIFPDNEIYSNMGLAWSVFGK
jgi:hypothetical protein